MHTKTLVKINESEAFECLKMIRTAPGKIYEYELYQQLNRPELAGCDRNMAQMINDLFELEFAICDVEESSYSETGLNVIYTNPKYRVVLDLLLSAQDYPLDRTTYIDYTEETVRDGIAKIRVFYTSVEKTLNELMRKHPEHFYILKALQIYRSWPQWLELEVMTVEDIARAYPAGMPVLSGKYIADFSYSRLTELLGYAPVLTDVKADRAFFVGSCIDFTEARFSGPASFKGSVFKANTLTFKNAKFLINAVDSESTELAHEVTFRNSRFFVSSLLMDEVLIDGSAEKKILSFEDAVLDARYISFSKMKLIGTELFCYQTLMGDASIRFVETQILDARMNFEDSVVNKVIMINVASVPETLFNFRHCQDLIIENCHIEKTLTLVGMEVLSLRNCSNQGKILTDWAGKTKDSKGNKNFPILLAVMNNADNDVDKAEQFVLLKDNFLGLGQYDYVDEAFTQYMIYKHKHSHARWIYSILRMIGQYGISPLKILTTMLVVILGFWVVNLCSMYCVSGAFSCQSEQLGFFSNAANALYLSVSNMVSYDSGISATHIFTIITSVLESIIGWFLLGYLSVAVVRKTLR